MQRWCWTKKREDFGAHALFFYSLIRFQQKLCWWWCWWLRIATLSSVFVQFTAHSTDSVSGCSLLLSLVSSLFHTHTVPDWRHKQSELLHQCGDAKFRTHIRIHRKQGCICNHISIAPVSASSLTKLHCHSLLTDALVLLVLVVMLNCQTNTDTHQRWQLKRGRLITFLLFALLAHESWWDDVDVNEDNDNENNNWQNAKGKKVVWLFASSSISGNHRRHCCRTCLQAAAIA